MDLMFAVLGILPLALFSFLSRGKRADAGLGFLAALVPALISAVGSIAARKGAQSQQQKAIDYQQQVAEQEAAQKEAQARAAYDAQQNSPQAQMQRLKFNTRLGALLGGFGGRNQTPGFILNAFDAARMPQEYQPGYQADYIAPPKQGGGFWDYAGDAMKGASYFDYEKYKQGKDQPAAGSPGAPMALPGATDYTQSVFGNQAASAALPSSYRSRKYEGLEELSPDVPIWNRK